MAAAASHRAPAPARNALFARRASLAAVSRLSRIDAGLEGIQEAVTLDAGLSLRLLRHLNSAWMALPHRVGSVHQAVAWARPGATVADPEVAVPA